MPVEPHLPGPTEAIRGIRRLELTDELEKLLRAAWKTGFRDDPDDSLLDAVAAALVNIGCSGAEGYERVMQIFGRLMVKYRDDEEKASALKTWIGQCRQN